MAITAQDIITEARDTLNDPGDVRWSEGNMLDYINAAVKQVALVRPDAVSFVDVVQLVPGTRQAIPVDGLRLLDVIRNMGSDGSTPSSAIRSAKREYLDLVVPGWHSAAGAIAVKTFTYDTDTPRDFYVFPPVTDTQQVHVEMSYSRLPAEVTQPADVISLDDVYEGPLTDWVLYLAYRKDISSAVSQAESRGYRQAFYASLGVKMEADKRAAPPESDGVKIE